MRRQTESKINKFIKETLIEEQSEFEKQNKVLSEENRKLKEDNKKVTQLEKTNKGQMSIINKLEEIISVLIKWEHKSVERYSDSDGDEFWWYHVEWVIIIDKQDNKTVYETFWESF